MSTTTTTRSDVIVVGAGSAGALVAARLADAGVHTTLLEAGGSDRSMNVRIPAAFTKLFRTKRDWAFWTEPQPNLDGRNIFWPRGRMLGGSSSMNAQMYVRGHRDDFDAWAAAGNRGWSYDDLLPAFVRTERNTRLGAPLHGGAGAQDVTDQRDPNPLSRDFIAAAVAAGIPVCADLAEPDLYGVALTQVTQRAGRRWSSADAFLRDRRATLKIRTNAHAARLLVNGSHVEGVELVGGQRLHAERVVVAAGAIGSPHLLLRSGIGPADELRAHSIAVHADLPGVGGNLQDHLVCPVVADVNVRHTLAGAERPGSLVRYLLCKRGLLTSNAAEAAAFVHTGGSAHSPEIELVFLPVPFENQGLGKPDRHAITIGVGLLTPVSRGTITLASADPTATPRIDPRYLDEPDDLRRLIAGIAIAEDVLARDPLATRLAPRHAIPDAAGHIRATAQSLYHPVGTCRMGDDDLAVVDRHLALHGLDNLHIADASVMPTITRGHTNAPTMAIAERAADILLEGSHASSLRSPANSAR